MLSLFTIILRNKKIVILVTMAGFVVSAAISMFIPPKYISSVSFMPAGVERELTGSDSFFGSLGSLGETYSTFVRVRRNFVIDAIVRSRRMSSLMTRKFGLDDRYGKSELDATYRELQKRTSVAVRDEGVLVLAVEDRDPVIARDMAEAFTGFIDSILIDLTLQNAESKMKFLQAEVTRRKERIAVADSAIQNFMRENDVFQVDQQAKAAIEVISGLTARRSMLEIEKEMLGMSLREKSPELERMDLELAKIGERIRAMVEGEGGGRLFPSLGRIPDLASEYVELVTEKMIQEFALAFVTLKLEDVTIAASVQSGVIRIIDPPFVPEIRSWPKRKQIVLVSTFAVFFWSCYFILLARYLKEGGYRKDAEGAGGSDAAPAGDREKEGA